MPSGDSKDYKGERSPANHFNSSHPHSERKLSYMAVQRVERQFYRPTFNVRLTRSLRILWWV